MPPANLRVEPAVEADGAEIARLYLAARADALPYLRRIHNDAAVTAWIRGVVLTHCQTWIARSGGRILGFMALEGEMLEQLYLLPGHYRRGIGTVLLEKAMALSPLGLRLFAFERNDRARRFYEAHGFRMLSRGDGSGNEEGEPDICYEWRPEPG